MTSDMILHRSNY